MNTLKVPANELCRFCRHAAAFHLTVFDFGKPEMTGLLKECRHPSARCKCEQYGPVDNLLYLESKCD